MAQERICFDVSKPCNDKNKHAALEFFSCVTPFVHMDTPGVKTIGSLGPV